MSLFRKSKEKENRLRLQKLVDQTLKSDTPIGWVKRSFAVGGLSEVGFSILQPELLLIISSRGRGVIDCSALELIDRDRNADFDWFDPYELWAMGIGKLSNEKIKVGGIRGGGLPCSNRFGDGIQFMATEWPIIDLIFQPNSKSIFRKGDEKDCFRIFHDYELIVYGFSYDGKYFVTATSSDINVYRKE